MSGVPPQFDTLGGALKKRPGRGEIGFGVWGGRKGPQHSPVGRVQVWEGACSSLSKYCGEKGRGKVRLCPGGQKGDMFSSGKTAKPRAFPTVGIQVRPLGACTGWVTGSSQKLGSENKRVGELKKIKYLEMGGEGGSAVGSTIVKVSQKQ